MTRIFLFPYGGGSAGSYRSYVARFPSRVGQVVPVELPGRGRRGDEAFATSIRECAARTLQQIEPAGDDYILHGHCMGALLAFEAIKLMEASGARLPKFMVVSGRNAPGHVNAWLERVPGLDDRALFEEMKGLGGIPQGLSFAMARHFLAVIRNDQAMLDGYDPGSDPIGVPILVLAGRGDRMTDPAGLECWRACTSRFASIAWLDGEHYFIFDQTEAVGSCIEEFRRSVETAAPIAAGNRAEGAP